MTRFPNKWPAGEKPTVNLDDEYRFWQAAGCGDITARGAKILAERAGRKHLRAIDTDGIYTKRQP